MQQQRACLGFALLFGLAAAARIPTQQLLAPGAGLNFTAEDESFAMQTGFATAFLGDVDGDGRDDLAVSAPRWNSEGSWVGRVYVLFGGAPTYDTIKPPNATDGFTVNWGSYNVDYFRFGFALSSAGDLNGDGLADIAIGSNYPSSASGRAYVIWGRAERNRKEVMLYNLSGSPADGVEIQGSLFESLGYTLDAAGDFNGDGIDDLLLGVPYATSGALQNAGCAVVVLGKREAWDGKISVFSEAPLPAGVVRVCSASAEEIAANTVAGIGDINGDGFDDIAIGTHSRSVVYVVFGKPGNSSTIDLPATFAEIDGSNGFKLFSTEDSYFGTAISRAGDVNGDGIADFVIGEKQGGSAGRAHIVFGKQGSWNPVLNLSLPSQGVVSIDGEADSDSFGASVGTAGDVNGDGVDDVAIGAPNWDASSVMSQAGAIYVIYGKPPSFSWPQSMGVSNLDPDTTGFRAYGFDSYDYTGNAISRKAGDFSGDGISDVLFGAYGYESNHGHAYLLFGSLWRMDCIVRETSGDCLKCNAGQAITGSSCADCPAGTWSAGGQATSCTNCTDEKCIECNATQGTCTKCADGYTLSNDGVCEDSNATSSASSGKHVRLFNSPDENVSRGFLVSVETAAVTRGLSEALSLLTRFANEFYGEFAPPPKAPASSAEDSSEDDDEEDDAAAAEAKRKKKKASRFRVYESGVAGLIAVKLTDPAISPLAFAERIAERICADPLAAANAQLKSCSRVLPVDAFCMATPTGVVDRGAAAVRARLGADCPPCTFAIQFRGRGSLSLPRADAIDCIAGLVAPVHKVDLEHPDVCIVAEVFKSVCSLTVADASVLERYRRFNFRELATAATVAAAPPVPAKKEEEEK